MSICSQAGSYVKSEAGCEPKQQPFCCSGFIGKIIDAMQDRWTARIDERNWDASLILCSLGSQESPPQAWPRVIPPCLIDRSSLHLSAFNKP